MMRLLINNRELRNVVVLVAILTLGGLGTVYAAGGTAPPFASIGIETVQLNGTHLSPSNPNEMRAFVETGSVDSHCLATLSEANFAGDVGISMLFCAPRAPIHADGFQRQGILLSVFFDGVPDEDVVLAVNLYQEHARFYEAPVLCQSSDGC